MTNPNRPVGTSNSRGSYKTVTVHSGIVGNGTCELVLALDSGGREYTVSGRRLDYWGKPSSCVSRLLGGCSACPNRTKTDKKD